MSPIRIGCKHSVPTALSLISHGMRSLFLTQSSSTCLATWKVVLFLCRKDGTCSYDKQLKIAWAGNSLICFVCPLLQLRLNESVQLRVWLGKQIQVTDNLLIHSACSTHLAPDRLNCDKRNGKKNPEIPSVICCRQMPANRSGGNYVAPNSQPFEQLVCSFVNQDKISE